MPDPTNTAISLTAIGNEILFIAQYAGDVLETTGTASDFDKARVKSLLIQARNDLAVVSDRIASHLGVNPLIET
jgi:hypothetical protein